MFRVAVIEDDAIYQWRDIYSSYDEAHSHLDEAQAETSGTVEVQTLAPGDEPDTSKWIEATPPGT